MRKTRSYPITQLLTLFMLLAPAARAAEPAAAGEPPTLSFMHPPAALANDLSTLRSPLLFDDGKPVRTPEDWAQRRTEILRYWHGQLGAWPPLLEKPRLLYRLGGESVEGFTRQEVRVQVAAEQTLNGYLLTPDGEGPFPAVLCVFYDPETSAGLGKDGDKSRMRAFGYDLAKRGFVALCIGSPGGDARKPDTAGHVLQPLSYLAYVAANCHTALSQLPKVDAKRIGVVGHSYGGKWAMFASCLYDKFAAAAWSDPGIVFDEARSNVNYWEPWYLGLDSKITRKPGVITPESPRTGPYKTIIESGHDLHELHALMAPRPFLVSGGSEDGPQRWRALNHSVAVNKLLGHDDRVGMTNRPAHDPTDESNRQMYAFFERYLKADH
jgi:dienelactone hydrolase